MAWRRGELWLDTDLVWFSERVAPAVAGFAPAAVPSFGPPPGLAASRQRREARRRQRYTRRLRATALVLSPAVLLPLAGTRGAGGEPAAEDPPSLTYRIDPATLAAAVGPAGLGAGSELVLPPPEAPPTIDWHRATSVGLPYGGSLLDGTQLPVEGPGWVTWNPVTDSVPNAPWRLYGHERTIRTLLSVTAAYRAANPAAPPVVVGDLSRRGGGPMRDAHVSHQNGLDVDVYYPRLDGTQRAPFGPDEVDRRLAQDLLDRFVAAGAQVIFVGYSTGLRGPAGIVTTYPNHENHMHVRFPPPGG